jgi:hypothetical protein
MKDNLNFYQLEDNLIFLINGRRPQLFQMEDNLNVLNKGQPKYSYEWKKTSNVFKWKTTSISLKSKDDLKKNNAT